jgi:hypothetical protein
MLNKFFLLCVLFILSCTIQQQPVQTSNSFKILNQELQFPEWLVNFPQEDHFTIGISYKTNDKAMIEEAKQSAAIFYSRNKASININKYAHSYDSDAIFKLIVSSEPEQLQKISDSLQVIDFFYINHYCIALFSLHNNENKHIFSNKIVSNHTQFKPDWYEDNKIVISDGVLFSYASSTASDLINAWKYASEKALLQIADYVSKEVHAKQLMIDERNYKFISVETATILDDVKAQHFFISSQIKDSLTSYSVFILLTIR